MGVVVLRQFLYVALTSLGQPGLKLTEIHRHFQASALSFENFPPMLVGFVLSPLHALHSE